ncbi:response regulator FixJ [Methylocystis sp. B8]|uniref:response regulator FixJ n=1 Tax=Methylocystis sp. B8 TaxID=544938 RepID=UPI0010FE3D6B|nr:response regulator FixJ [Methylocystis sp. B8]TLG73721.1 response regulator transcription factor [Methylocystis sp. B8]
MSSRTIYIVDDDSAVREALQLLLESEGYAVSGFPSASAMLSSLGPESAGCVIADVRMPGLSGLDLIVEMKSRNLRLPIIIITGHGDVPLAVEAMKRGAVDFLEKPFDDEALFAAVKRALLPDATAQENRTEESHAPERFMLLTKRERQILERLVEGRSNKVIAHDLDISVRTVEAHRANVMAKMRVKNLAELVRMFLNGRNILVSENNLEDPSQKSSSSIMRRD